MKAKQFLYLYIIIFALLATAEPGEAQSTAFTYQGRLNAAGSPANGNYDLSFALYPAGSGGAAVGNFITNSGVPVSNGIFMATLNFGNVFNAAPCWLEIGVRTNGNTNSFTTLTPRQYVAASPYSLYSLAAGNVTGVLAATNLPANVALLNGNANFAGTATASNFVGNATGLTNIPAGQLAGALPKLNAINLTNLSPSIFNVRDYGAVGDGVTQDYLAVSNALHALTSHGYGWLYFPAQHSGGPTKYLLTNGLVFDYKGNFPPYTGGNYQPSPYAIVGEGIGSTFLVFNITNSVGIWATNQMPMMRDIGIMCGVPLVQGGTNYGVRDWGGNGGAEIIWNNVALIGWWTGADLAGSFGCNLQNLELHACGTGLYLPDYNDGFDITAFGDLNTNAAIMIGGVSAGAAWNTSNFAPSHGNDKRIQFTGTFNNIGVIVGGYESGTIISGYQEMFTNCAAAVGHPPYLGDSYDDGGADISVRFSGFTGLSGSAPLIGLYHARRIILDLSGSEVAGGVPTVKSFTNTADNARISVNNNTVQGFNWLLSTGVDYGYPGFNVDQSWHNKTLGQFAGSNLVFSVVNGNMMAQSISAASISITGGLNAWGSATFGGVAASGAVTAQGVGSLATNTANITPTGWTNTTGVNMEADVVATAATYTVYNGAGTPVFTNPAFTGVITHILQPGGKITAASGLAGSAHAF